MLKGCGQAQSAVASAALTRLLDSNLSAKYWVADHLDSSDVIKDMEFFDAGTVSVRSCVVPCYRVIQSIQLYY